MMHLTKHQNNLKHISTTSHSGPHFDLPIETNGLRDVDHFTLSFLVFHWQHADRRQLESHQSACLFVCTKSKILVGGSWEMVRLVSSSLHSQAHPWDHFTSLSPVWNFTPPPRRGSLRSLSPAALSFNPCLSPFEVCFPIKLPCYFKHRVRNVQACMRACVCACLHVST